MAVTEENPLVEGLERLPVHPTTLVIFGGTGDLAHRKLLPAIYNLAHEGALPEGFNLIAVSRSEMSDDEYRKMARESIQEHSRRPPDEQVLEKLLEHVRYVAGTFDVDDVFERLKDELGQFDEEAGIAFNRIFYLSTAPSFFALIVKKLGEHELHKHPEAEVRVVIEKPFGTRLTEALELNRELLSVLHESQIFRIDHYLGKETVQNMLAFRFANGMFEPIWNRNFIDYVQITAAEDLGIGRRAGYYDEAGALRDLVQNHMLQLLSLLCMEPPVTFDADEVRDEKVKVLHAVEPPAPDAVVRAQYTSGMAEGKEAVGYLGGAGRPAGLRHRDLRGPPPRGGQLALGRRADLPAHRQAARPQGHRDRGDAEAGAAPRVRGRRLGRSAAEPDHPGDAAERGRVDLARREDPREPHAHPAGEHGVPLRDVVPVAVARGVRAADPRRDARRRDALHPQRRGRGAVADHRSDPGVVGDGRRAARHLPRRLARPAGGGRDPRPGPSLAGHLAMAPKVVPEVPDEGAVWSAQDTTPGAIEEALRDLLTKQYARDQGHAPARVLNLVVVVDREWRGEIMNRLEQVGRYHASRTILCDVEPGRTTIDASVVLTVEGERRPESPVLTRERVIIEVGPKHLSKLDTIVDPLVVTDLPTVVWAPHGHPEALDALLHISQVVLIDSVGEPDPASALGRAEELSADAYVVDLAWLRTTPWRERVASTFDPPRWRDELWHIDSVKVRHRPDSGAAGILFFGWLASRLGWGTGSLMPANGAVRGHAERTPPERDAHARARPAPGRARPRGHRDRHVVGHVDIARSWPGRTARPAP